MVKDPDPSSQKILYDKQTGYFRRDLIVFKNLDLSRASDVLSLCLLVYIVLTLATPLPTAFYVMFVSCAERSSRKDLTLLPQPSDHLASASLWCARLCVVYVVADPFGAAPPSLSCSLAEQRLLVDQAVRQEGRD